MTNQSENKLLLEKLESDLLDERTAYSRRNNSKDTYESAQKQLTKTIAEIGRTGDVDIILSGEKRILQNERRHYANSKEMVSSLNTALQQITGAQKLSKRVKDSDLYKEVDDIHCTDKTRTKGLPKDVARQYFTSQRTRFSNLNRGRLSLTEKTTLGERQTNNIIAEKRYADLQREALGLNPKKKDRDFDISM